MVSDRLPVRLVGRDQRQPADVVVVFPGAPVDANVVVAGLRRLDLAVGGLALHVVLVLADVLALELREREPRAGPVAQPGPGSGSESQPVTVPVALA